MAWNGYIGVIIINVRLRDGWPTNLQIKCTIASLVMMIKSWSWCPNIYFQGLGNELLYLIHHWYLWMTWNSIRRSTVTWKYVSMANLSQKDIITCLIMKIKSWFWCPSICFQGLGSKLYHLILKLLHFYEMKCLYSTNSYKYHAERWLGDKLQTKIHHSFLSNDDNKLILVSKHIFSGPRKWIIWSDSSLVP